MNLLSTNLIPNMNRYLEKIASDLDMAQKSKNEEDKAIADYTDRINRSKDQDLKEALTHARKEEKDHSHELEKVIKKLRNE